MANKSIYTRKLGETVARNAKRTIKGKYHLIPLLSDKWAVVSNGRIRPIKSFTTQKQAVSFVKKFATPKFIIHVHIHGKDGRIKESMSYSKPKP